MQVNTIGVDLTKNVFQVHGVDSAGKVVITRKLRRKQVIEFLSKIPPCLVGMEAGGTAHHWPRDVSKLGHTVRLMPPRYVKGYVKRSKNDAADAPVIGYLNIRPETAHDDPFVKGINQALTEMGLVEGRNFISEYRFADRHRERLPELASDLVQRNVAIIVTSSMAEALAARAATNSIPVVFIVGADPVATGLVASMNRPGGNLTG